MVGAGSGLRRHAATALAAVALVALVAGPPAAAAPRAITPPVTPDAPGRALCGGKVPTMFALNDTIGSAGDDVIMGSPYHDRIYALGGNDIICGAGEGDEIWGQSGNDTIYGGAGNDVIYPGSGDDTVYGGTGDDTILLEDGVANNDYADCGPGVDILFTSGDVYINCTP